MSGRYTCTVTNDLGSDSKTVALGEWNYFTVSPNYPVLLYCIGITFSGLDDPLTVGQSATISCMPSIAVESIKWKNQSSSVLNMSSGVNLTMLEYTIPVYSD